MQKAGLAGHIPSALSWFQGFVPQSLLMSSDKNISAYTEMEASTSDRETQQLEPHLPAATLACLPLTAPSPGAVGKEATQGPQCQLWAHLASADTLWPCSEKDPLHRAAKWTWPAEATQPWGWALLMCPNPLRDAREDIGRNCPTCLSACRWDVEGVWEWKTSSIPSL